MAPSRLQNIAPVLATALIACGVNGQVSNATTAASSATVTSGLSFVNPSGYSTQTYNESAATTHLPNDDYSDERLNFLWAQVSCN